MTWKPIGAAANFHETLYEGVPVWMTQELRRWFREGFAEEAVIQLAEQYDSAARNEALIAPTVEDEGPEEWVQYADAEVVVSFLDYLIRHLSAEAWASPRDRSALTALSRILERSGSMWKVGDRDGFPGLERRVPEGVQETADHVVGSSGSAGQLLAEAWNHAFGVSPNPEEAYEKAIKAAEQAGAAVVLPKNPKATLGTMIATMRAHGDWSLEITDSSGAHFGDVVLRMCEALWQGQPSRHGGNGYRKPTQGEAEAAVMLAVPLVQWFHSGAVARRP